jgi:hypothetical protein
MPPGAEKYWKRKFYNSQIVKTEAQEASLGCYLNLNIDEVGEVEGTSTDKALCSLSKGTSVKVKIICNDMPIPGEWPQGGIMFRPYAEKN